MSRVRIWPQGLLLFAFTFFFAASSAEEVPQPNPEQSLALTSNELASNEGVSNELALAPDDDHIAGETGNDLAGILGALGGGGGGDDMQGLMSMLGGGGMDMAELEKILAGFGQPLAPEKDPVPYDTFEEVVAAYEAAHQTTELPLHDRELSMNGEGAESSAVEPLETGTSKLLKKYSDFVTKYLGDGNRVKFMVVAYIMYRQATWIWQKWWIECKKTPRLPAPTLFDRVTGIQDFPNRFGSVRTPGFWSVDLTLRTLFFATHSWLKLRQWWQGAQEQWRNQQLITPQQQAECLRDLSLCITTSYNFFSSPTYYGMNMSFTQELLVELALPFAYATFMSRDPVNHSVFAGAFAGLAGNTVFQFGQRWSNRYRTGLSTEQKESWFNRTLGVLRPSNIVVVSRMVSGAVQQYLLGRPVSLKKEIGKETIRLVYLYIVIGMLREATRHGVLQHLHGAVNLVCKGLRKVGIMGESPLDKVRTLIEERLKEIGFLHKGQPLYEIMTSVGYIFPGALVRAVRREMTKQDLPRATYRSPRFVDALGDMNGLGPLDPLGLVMNDPQTFIPKFGSSVTAIVSGIPQDKRAAVMTTFFNEVVAEVCFNRDSPICYMLTETILQRLGNSLLVEVGTAVL